MTEPAFSSQHVHSLPEIGVSHFMKSSKGHSGNVLMRALHDQQVPLLKCMLGCPS